MTLDCPRVCLQLRTQKNLKIRLQSKRIPNHRKKYLCIPPPPLLKKPFSKICFDRLLRCFFIMAIISAKLLRYVRQVLMFLRPFNHNKFLKKLEKGRKNSSSSTRMTQIGVFHQAFTKRIHSLAKSGVFLQRNLK